MFFGWFKSKKQDDSTTLSKHLIEHLNIVDKEYMKAFSIKSTRVLQAYVSRDCAIKVSQSIFSLGSRYFGADKFRTTNWVLVSEIDGILEVYKDVVFDKVKIGGSMRIGVADNYKELWQIDNTVKSKPIVLDISKVQG